MNRESIIIIICIGIVVLFYLFRVNPDHVKQIDLVKKQTVQSFDDKTKDAAKQTLKEDNTARPDSLDNQEDKGYKPK